jgi:hypothetical protein
MRITGRAMCQRDEWFQGLENQVLKTTSLVFVSCADTYTNERLTQQLDEVGPVLSASRTASCLPARQRPDVLHVFGLELRR